MKKVDLHIHTSFSDGIYTPKKILELARKNNVEFIAITDHDTFSGYHEAKKIVADYGLELIPGVEISTSYKNVDVHILAYYPDVKNKELNEMLNNIQLGRFCRAKKILASLNDLNMPLELDRIIELAGENDLIGRPHIARAMIAAGYVQNKNEAFDKYLGDGRKAFHPKPSPSPEKIIKIIKKAGGISVLAHPQTLQNDDLVYDIIGFGIDGLEVYYGKSGFDITKHYEAIALENGLIRTGGTDFHGEGYDKQVFESFVAPDSVLKELKARKKKVNNIFKRIYEKI
ncbi:MAG: PHP domain-containing protein [Candidatus Cloacimonetes bacterium]|nr:PHP domain-containing protein [Candidatus Cloacimonadota bacterium]